MLRAAPGSGNDPVENSWSTAQLLSLKKRKPFDILVEGLTVSSSRGDRTPIELFVAAAFTIDTLMKQVTPKARSFVHAASVD